MIMPRASRRDFFRTTGALSALSTVWPLGRVLAQNGAPDEYRALVCVYLQGGNDSNNMVIPLGASYNDSYLKDREHIAIPDSDLSALTIANQADTAVNPTGEAWGFHPAFSPEGRTGLHDLFNQGDLAVIANVGTLVEPTTAAQLRNGHGALPIQLASHRDQTLQWHAAISDRPFASGWGGRITDSDVVVEDLSNRISLQGAAQFLTGTNTAQGMLQAGGEIGSVLQAESDSYLLPLLDELYQNPAGQNTSANLFTETFKTRTNQIRTQNELLRGIVEDFVKPAGWPVFPIGALGRQLERAAVIASAQATLGQNRQVFYATAGGFDTHSNQSDTHGRLLEKLNDALVAFHQALGVLGKQDAVTTFTASDFNRTWTNNRDNDNAGTDHAWGGHALVMGGAVDGGHFYGRMPILALNGPDHSPVGGRASWVPSVAVDELAATLAKWFGLDNTQLHEVFPNLNRFNNQDLGLFR